VAAEGGGIRAAYWTAAVLDRLERESRGAFSERLLAVSSVSGGSLGAVVFAAQLADGTPPSLAEQQARAFLGADHLSPVLGSLLFPEVAQKLLPVPVFPDRARALERSWEEGWARAAGEGGRGRLAAPLLRAFATAPGGRELPVLLLNATRVETGTRVIASNASTRQPFGAVFPDATDAFTLADAQLPASAAAHLSARFPYVSPAAAFEKGHVVDGGYFDGIGAATLLDLLDLLRRLGDGEPGHGLEPYVLLVTNGDAVEARSPPLVQLFAPLQALLRSGSARSVWTTGELRAAVASAGGRCLQLGVREREVPLPLGWMLSSLAQRQLSAEADGVGWDAADGPRCGGRGGDPAASGDLECSCEELATHSRD
jgi:predicted acylesterase/phospholipase RssA